MLIKSGLPETFWAEDVNTVVYTLNRCPYKSDFKFKKMVCTETVTSTCQKILIKRLYACY